MAVFWQYIHPSTFDNLADVRKFVMDESATEIETEKNFFLTVKSPGLNQYISTDIAPMREVVKKHRDKKKLKDRTTKETENDRKNKP